MNSLSSSETKPTVRCPVHYLFEPSSTLQKKSIQFQEGDLFKAWRADVEAMNKPSVFERLKALKKMGIRGAWKTYRWKFVAGVFFYYLIRDLFLYVFIPFLIIKTF